MSTTAQHGHVNPVLPVLAELVARGHRVTYPVPDRFSDAVAATGATVLPIRADHPGPMVGEELAEGGVLAGRQRLLVEARSAYAQMTAELDGDMPDIVAYDSTGWAGKALARLHDRPAIELAPHVVPWEGFAEQYAAHYDFLDAPSGRAWQHDMNAWLAEIGVSMGNQEFLGSPDRSVVLIPAAMQPHLDRVDQERYTFVGPVIGDRSRQGTWPEPDRPLLLVSLGSTFTDRPGFWRDCVAAMHGTGWLTVLAIGSNVDPADLGDLPEDVIARQWVPQLAVLEHASAFVTHAGMGACSEGLWHGVPMVAVPQATDQIVNGPRLAELGVGELLPAGELTPSRLRDAVRRVSSSEIIANSCAEHQRIARGAGGAAAAADEIESLVR
ncbi:macrolide family glycosyltransferase [Brachybacterium sp. AOP43-C2-M15]|uniref:macrolide family glycosyltransferase n=1 Tax=Brachybacterium sp. AOP43-C2-M15 TaxID=3457661 RepID=UPI004033B81E